MTLRIGLVVVALLALGASAQAQTRPRAGNCLDRLHRDGADLPAASRQARSTLIANPGRIGAVAARAARAPARERAEVELGIARAAEWLQCVDPYGYQAISDYLRTHPADLVAADLSRALNAQAAAGGRNAGAGPSEASAADANVAGGANTGGAGLANASGAAAPAFGAASFAAAGPIVSPSH